MSAASRFDLLNSPLEGTTLIEASAGTGKTYAITGLFLRLILEKKLAVDRILVVTFTEAATAELRDRIRNKLREAIIAFSSGESKDLILYDFVHKYGDKQAALKNLNDAIRDFDQAAIFTIHGFCKRMLYENAFESGSLFDTELIADQENLIREIVEDFWRQHFYQASPLFVDFAMNKNLGPDTLLSLFANRITQPDLKVIPCLEIPNSSQQEREYQESFQKVQQLWQPARKEIEQILLEHQGLNRAKYKKENIPHWIDNMDRYAATGMNTGRLFEKFERFTKSEIEGAIKGNHAIPAHPFFERCQHLKEKYEALQQVFEQRVLGLKIKLFHDIRSELQKRKEEKNIQSFDDLLLKMHQALAEAGGGELAHSIRKKYKAALIDEFQDTDPIQYSIFKNIFEADESILFLIGDPKQAIYGFRGADVFAYMEAARHTRARFTLVKNWRSEQRLVTAVNTIFGSARQPFIFGEIPYDQVEIPSEKKNSAVLTIENAPGCLLQLWFVNASNITGSGKPLSKSTARQRIAQAVAAEISDLLKLGRDRKALIGTGTLKESDIAVLVRRNAEALLIQEALAELNIPSVLYNTGNIFDSQEASEIELVLAAIAEPQNDKFLRAALTTDMLGMSGEEINKLIENETAWQTWLIKFQQFHDLWSKRGFISMFRQFIGAEKILPRLMAMSNGERRNTNLLHLAEVIHNASVEKKLGLKESIKWLSEQRDPRTPRLEEHQLRLETDEKAVKLVTIHKSKGLEYPIVFCPFNWDGSKIKKSSDYFIFHDEHDAFKLILDLGSNKIDENRVLAEKEQLAENLRLLYVAITRAIHRCYLVWGRFNEAETSALAYLFHQPAALSEENIVDAISNHFNKSNDREVLSKLSTIVEQSGGTIGLEEMPAEPGKLYSPFEGQPEELIFKEFKVRIDQQWRISSFSSLVYRQPFSAELADHDITPASEQIFLPTPIIPDKIDDIFALPGGRKTGLLLHKILEHLDFTQQDTTCIKNLIVDKMNEYRYDFQWLETVCRMVQNLMNTTLSDFTHDFLLSRIPNQDRLNEIEFYFPIKLLSAKKLKRIFLEYSMPDFSTNFPEQIEELNFSPARGFMKGFIDMVFQFGGKFYLVDWKSNHLGNRIEDYSHKSLIKAMENNYYFFQYHIYAIALNQYLKLRMPGYNYRVHFGGIFYLFLRGIYPAKGCESGIFNAKPSEELIEALSSEIGEW